MAKLVGNVSIYLTYSEFLSLPPELPANVMSLSMSQVVWMTRFELPFVMHDMISCRYLQPLVWWCQGRRSQ